MLHALRAELIYFRPWLLGGLGIATFVSTLLIVLTVFVNDSDGVPAFVVGMFPIIAGMVVAFIAQSYRSEERRARLLFAGPMTPRQLAGVMVLLPAVLVGLGALFGGLLVAVTSLLVSSGALEGATVPTLGMFSVQFWAYAQMGPLAQEATAARRQKRGTAAIIGWGFFVGAILFLVASQFVLGSIFGRIGLFAVVATAMVVAAALYAGRTDFTR
jgi:hypothetical protein